MFLSLAFVPVAVIALLATLGMLACGPDGAGGEPDRSKETKGGSQIFSRTTLKAGLRQSASCIAWGIAGFAIPTFLAWFLLKLNLIAVWRMNFLNHAAFYDHYSRSYGKWLLVNPLEFVVAAGAPLTVLATWSLFRQWRLRGAAPGAGAYQSGAHYSSRETGEANHQGTVLYGLRPWLRAWLVVLGLLWISGRNMGEAARLWIFLMPFLVWAAGPIFDSASRSAAAGHAGAQSVAPDWDLLPGLSWAAALAAQLVTTAAIVTRVVGFHYP
jgi:hypothetical protein